MKKKDFFSWKCSCPVSTMNSVMFVLAFLLFLAFVVDVHAQGAYRIPFNQNDSLWSTYKSTKERVDALQIPNEVLDSITTSNLLNVCLDFPYLMDIMLANNLQEGMEGLVKEYNGFRELLSRNDLLEVILEKQKECAYKYDSMEGATMIEKGTFSIRNIAIGMILVQDNFWNNLDEERKEILVQSTISYYNQIDESSLFGNLNRIPYQLLFAKKALDDHTMAKSLDRETNEALMDCLNCPLNYDKAIMTMLIKLLTDNKMQ